MLVDKPDWVSHGGASIFAVDVHPAGTRFVTGGADSKVRIWALAPLLEEVASSKGEEGDPFSSTSTSATAGANASSATPRLLATLSDNLGSVNAVRFSESGTRLATGADDGAACVFELRGPSAVGLLPAVEDGTSASKNAASAAATRNPAAAAAATRNPAAAAVLPGTAFIGGGPPSLEQWKLAVPLRAHTNNVTDVAWSPGDRYVATASLDNTVVVWEISSSTGRRDQPATSSSVSARRVATLEGHESYVKGVSFDPLGKYLASQSDDASVVVWRTDDWLPAARVTEPFSGGTVSSSFSTRLCWAPDGTFLVACNAFDRRAGVQLAPVVSRAGGGAGGAGDVGPWESAFKLVGHSGAVVASRASGKLFVPPSPGGEGEGKGDRKDKGDRKKKVDPSAVGRAVALGAQDGKVSVWVTTRPTPVAVASRFFKQSVVDLAWTPDGYALLAVSSDGTLACFQFEEGELGVALSDDEATELRREMFGDERARTARFAETAGQLMLEKGGGGDGASAGKASAAAAAPASASELLAARLAPANGTAATLSSAAAPPRRTAAASMVPPPPPPPLLPRAPGAAVPAGGAGGAVAILAAPPVPQDFGGAPLRGGGGKRQRHSAPSWPLAPPPLVERVAAPVPSDDAPSSSGTAGGGGGVIEAVNALGPAPRADAPARATATVALTRYRRRPTGSDAAAAAKREWEDVVPGGVSSLVASRRFAAAATGGSPLDGGGALVLWSRAGRRLAPPLSLPAPVVHLSTDDGDRDEGGGGEKRAGEEQRGWRLLAVTADGGVHCWDVRARSLTLRTSLAPLLAVASAHAAAAPAPAAATAAEASAAASSPSSSSPPVGLASAKICRATGAPTVVLTDLSAAAFDLGLGGWARVADGVGGDPASSHFARSAFATSAAAPPPPPGMNSNAFGAPGELRALQAASAAAGGPAAALAAAARLASPPSAGAAAALRSATSTDTRAHIESNVAAAAALGSGVEWREWTLAYVRHLAAGADEERLREVFEELLGPARLPRPAPSRGAKTDGRAKTDADGAAPSAPPARYAWSPTLGGVDKRALLRDALVEASRNRAVQRTVAEFDSLLGFAA